MMDNSQTLCDQCGKTVPVISGYIPWCDCGWNLDFSEMDKTSDNPFQKIYKNLGQRRGRAIYNHLKNKRIEKSGFSFTNILIVSFAIAIQMLVLCLFLLGLYLIIFNFSNILMLILGIGLLGMTWLSRPRFQSVPPNNITKENFPEVHKLVKKVSDALEIAPPDFIVIDAGFNAGISTVGIFQKKAIFIGFSLFTILDAEEKIALISHELAHFSNGDPLRFVFVSTTLNTLIWWHHILHRDYFWDFNNGIIMAIAEFISNMLFHILSFIPLVFIYIFTYMVLDQSQKAEYLADKLGTQISGTKAFINMLEKSLLYPQISIAIQRAALNKNTAGAIGEIQKEIHHFPPRQFERITRTAEFEESSLDATHPPTAFRIKMLNAIRDPVLTLSKMEEIALNKELEKLTEEINKKLTDSFQRSLYY